MPSERLSPEPRSSEIQHPMAIFFPSSGEGKISYGDDEGFTFVPIRSFENYVRDWNCFY